MAGPDLNPDILIYSLFSLHINLIPFLSFLISLGYNLSHYWERAAFLGLCKGPELLWKGLCNRQCPLVVCWLWSLLRCPLAPQQRPSRSWGFVAFVSGLGYGETWWELFTHSGPIMAPFQAFEGHRRQRSIVVKALALGVWLQTLLLGSYRHWVTVRVT